MIPKNHYALYCLRKDGEGEVIIPTYFDEAGRPVLSLYKDPSQRYINDYLDVIEYIDTLLVNKYVKILILKVVEAVKITMESCYRNNLDEDFI